ncbi:MAG TPA: AIPR family protein [Paracoccaceae bacterium]|nr:AIPR family protein [Paracoccaceae bacterium]HMO70754.1 AIPR family protein [Paracoccaceae bacterium]
MNPIIRALLNEFKKANSGTCHDDSEAFEVMCIFSVENGILGENIDPFRVHLKGDEFGLDGIAISIQGSICTDADEASSVLSVGKNHNTAFHFFQAKTSDNLDYGEVSKFLDAVYDFFTELSLLSGVQIEDLAHARDLVFAAATKSNPELRCYFCTTGSGEISAPIGKLIESGRARLEALNTFSAISIDCLGAKQIQDGFRSATNSITKTINFPKATTMPPHDKVDEAYIGYISADQVLEMALSDEDSNGDRHIVRSVFYDNVRDFNPQSEINKSVIQELESGDYSSFVFKNNGITVVAKTVSRKGDAFTIDDFQIVNGCQTTNILACVRGNAEDIMVPFRLIGSSDSDFVAKIIVGTNKQNEVREDQFWALLPFMKNLEIYCAAQEGDSKILIERRENQYRDVAAERTRVMRTSDLMKVAAAMFFHQPHRAARDHRGIRKEFADKIFRVDHSVELYHVAALAMYKFDYMVRTSKLDRTRSIYKFYALFALSKMLWREPTILGASSKNRSKFHNQALGIILDQDKFSAHIERVSVQIEGMIVEAGIKTREQVRDYIRTESFADQFSKKFSESY